MSPVIFVLGTVLAGSLYFRGARKKSASKPTDNYKRWLQTQQAQRRSRVH